MEFITKSEYAARIGVSKSYISKLTKEGRLVLDEAGRVNVQATDALLAKTADPSKAGVAERHQRERADKGVHAHVTPSAPATLSAPPPQSGTKQPDFQKARAHREHFLALLAEDEFRKGRGDLVEREVVDREGFDIARTVRDLLLGLPAKISGELIAINDAWEMEQRLTALFRAALAEAAGEVSARSAAADLAEEAA